MGPLVLQGDPPIAILLRRNSRSRRLSLRVSRLDGRVTMSMPGWVRRGDAMDFAIEKEGWIRSQLSAGAREIVPGIGGTVLLGGVEVPIVAVRARAARFADGALQVPGKPERAAGRIAAFLKVMARQKLTEACDRSSALLRCSYSRITLRDTRSRWGSCTANGNLMFSWRLVMAPPEVLEYVAVHEVAHLVEMNHSPAYWSVVERISPDFAAHRKWLRRNGLLLHRYRFGN